MVVKIIHGGYFKLDGGAMYGVVPKKMWHKLNPPDENNMCTWAMRCLIAEEDNRVMLFDTGMGDKQDEKFKSHFEPHGPHSLLASIAQAGYALEEITDVFLTHLHFDHCGGALYIKEDGTIAPLFPNATYWTNEEHLNSALNPNPREKASFLKENIVPLAEHKVLKHIPVERGIHFTQNIKVDFYYGHTTAMMVPTLHLANGNKLVFPADLLPSSSHVRMPYVMSYDINPLTTLNEKEIFYEKSLSPDTYFVFEHDKDISIGQLQKNEKGRYSIAEANSDDIFSEVLRFETFSYIWALNPIYCIIIYVIAFSLNILTQQTNFNVKSISRSK